MLFGGSIMKKLFNDNPFFQNKEYENNTPTSFSDPIIMHTDKVGIDYLPYPEHFHEEIEVHHVLEGRAHIKCNKTDYYAEAGDIVVIYPYSLHCFENVGHYCRTRCILFHPIIISEVFSEKFPSCFILNDHEFVQTINIIANEWQNKQENFGAAIRGEIISLFARMGRMINGESVTDKVDYQAINISKNVISYITEHFSEKLTIEELSKIANLSPSYFCHCFSKATGKSVTQYIIDVRCKNAYFLIKSGRFKIGEAASLSGFDNMSYFTRKFKEVYGFLPSESKNYSLEKT